MSWFGMWPDVALAVEVSYVELKRYGYVEPILVSTGPKDAYRDDDPAGEGPTGDWVAIDSANAPRLFCPCWPSQVVNREGEHIGVVVVHHAYDGRETGTSA